MSKHTRMDYRLLIDTAILAGEIMLKNGAETYRVEDTVARILEVSKCKHTHVVAMTTSIIATISDYDMDPITVIRRIDERVTNLNKVFLVNGVSREFCSGKIDLETAFLKLKNIVNTHEYNTVIKCIATAVVVPMFVILFGGSLIDIIIGFFSGIILTFFIQICELAELNTFVSDLITAAFVSLFIKMCGNYVLILDVDLVIISSIMPLVPGVAITNAIRDTLQGDYMSGCARTMEAFVKALSIALGVLIGIGL